MKKTLKEEELKYRKVVGLVGDKSVIAIIYPRNDSGLSHYIVDRKTYVGTVEFTQILREKWLNY